MILALMAYALAVELPLEIQVDLLVTSIRALRGTGVNPTEYSLIHFFPILLNIPLHRFSILAMLFAHAILS